MCIRDRSSYAVEAMWCTLCCASHADAVQAMPCNQAMRCNICGVCYMVPAMFLLLGEEENKHPTNMMSAM
eukprot:9403939-Pyramimonas_sp.AAC.1